MDISADPKAQSKPVVHSDRVPAAGKLRSLIERIERLEEEKAALGADIREVYSEAKGQGFDTKIMRKVVQLRKLETADRLEQQAILDDYLEALGMS